MSPEEVAKIRAEHDILFSELEQLAELNPEIVEDVLAPVSSALSSAVKQAKSSGMPSYDDLSVEIGPVDEGAAGFVPLPAAPIDGGQLPDPPELPTSPGSSDLYDPPKISETPLPGTTEAPPAYAAPNLDQMPALEPAQPPLTPPVSSKRSEPPEPLGPEIDAQELPGPPETPKVEPSPQPALKGIDLSDAIFDEVSGTQELSPVPGIDDVSSAMKQYSTQIMDIIRVVVDITIEGVREIEELRATIDSRLR